MTPEEAQRLTEEKWEELAAGEGRRGAPCGWCLFAGRDCSACPVVQVTGCLCENLEVMQRHYCDPTSESAQAVLDYLREHGEEYIKAAVDICVKLW